MNVKDERRFWNKVDKRGACWLWTASTQRGGYGSFRLNGKIEKAHRVSYGMAYGFEEMNQPDPTHEGHPLTVMHKCPVRHNPRCVNPRHLRLGTHAENLEDMRYVGNQAHLKGESNGNRRLTEAQVLEIREKYATGRYTKRRLATEFGVSDMTIHRIVNRINWKHI